MDKAKIIIDRLLQEVDDEEADTDFRDVDIPSPERDRFDAWAQQYRPIKNHLNPDAPFDGTMFETYSPEIDFVKTARPQHIWTWVSGDENQDIIVAGYHIVNRNGFFITELPWKSEDESFEFGEGDPQTAQQVAEAVIENQLGRDWKTEWRGYPPETKIEKIRAEMEIYGLEQLDPNEIMAIIDNRAT